MLVYAAISRSDSGGGGSTADVPVVVAKSSIPAGTAITAGLVEVRRVPESAVGSEAFTTIDDVVGQVAKFPLAPNEQLLVSKFVATTVGTNDALSYVLEDGMRGMAVTVEQVIAAGGLVLPGDHVDVLWIPFKGAPSFTLLSDVEVTAVQQTIADLAPAAPGLQQEGAEPASPAAGGQRARVSDAEADPKAITVTMMIASDDAERLFCSEWFASQFAGSIRLSVRSFGDARPATVNAPECPPLDLMRQITQALSAQ
ncbi:MAG: Flp pilus assembly protein CpaB [Chloroflexi bacterium]|nr:Flp pilus assembly protein CpaB [Chloroflexota bacterium]